MSATEREDVGELLTAVPVATCTSVQTTVIAVQHLNDQDCVARLCGIRSAINRALAVNLRSNGTEPIKRLECLQSPLRSNSFARFVMPPQQALLRCRDQLSARMRRVQVSSPAVARATTRALGNFSVAYIWLAHEFFSTQLGHCRCRLLRAQSTRVEHQPSKLF
jgi:hypothetical protein